MSHEPTAQSNSDRLDTLEAVERVGSAVLSKTATWAVSVAVLVLSVAISFGGIIYMTGDKLLKFQEASLEIRSIQAEHEHCKMELAELKLRVARLEQKTTASN